MSARLDARASVGTMAKATWPPQDVSVASMTEVATPGTTRWNLARFCAVSSSRWASTQALAPSPIIFAMANPDPEIRPEVAKAARPDAIIATGRSDYPNQVNNVIGFPFIFRGALDVRATKINEEMKVAAARAIAGLYYRPL